MSLLNAALAALPFVQWTTIIALLFIAGIAWSFNLWIIPIIKLNKSSSAIAQFQETSRRGGMWLEPLNASFALVLGATTLLLTQHPDPVKAAQWKFYAISCATLVQVAWWERVMIFPLERSVAAMKESKKHTQRPEQNWMEQGNRLALRQAMDSWSHWHAVRATLPLVAALIALSAKAQHLY